MRILKFALLSLFFLLLLVTAISLLIPSHIRLSKAINLPNQREQIFVLLKNDTSWQPAYGDTASATAFQTMDKQLLEQTDSTFVVRWQQNGRKPVVSGWQLHGSNNTDSLTLQWYLDLRSGWYPWQKISSLFYEQTYGVLMEKGLNKLKQQLVRNSAQ